MKKKILLLTSVLFLLLSILQDNYVYAKISKGSDKNLASQSCGCSDNYKVNKKDDEDSEKKIIYLTFDDGPSPKITNRVLDILKENDVKATFFLIGNKVPKQQEVVKRIYDEGHGIGLHTYTHDFKKIYRSKESFMEEMVKCSDEIYKVTGFRSNIIRFPGGSNKQLNEEFLDQIHEKGFKVFDWNIQLSDGINYRIPPENLYREGTKNKNNYTNIILLMHCDAVNKNTCEALPGIIKHYKQQGYEFKVIDKDTPEYHFRLCKVNR